MVGRWRSGLAAAGVTVATVVLVLLDIGDDGVRAWWTGHALTASTVSGLLVLLITVLVVDQVGDLRRARSRSRAVAAQAAMVLGQARRSSRSLAAALDGDGGRDEAADDARTYLVVLVVSGPLLIDTATARAFLEEAQRFGAVLTRLVDPQAPGALGGDPAAGRDTLSAAVARLETTAGPVVDVLHPVERAATAGPDQGPA